MIEYVSGDRSMLDEIGPLWAKLQGFHVGRATRFAQEMAAVTFSERAKSLLAKAGASGVHVDVAVNPETDMRVGYCISSVDPHKKGEADSLYVEELYRGQGVGEALMRRAMAWLRAKDVQSILIGVAAGNEDVFDFYARFGFYPRTILLAQPKKAEG